ncbi:MAG: APC family permease [Microbacterium sp.]|uniref:APC family permease n=1 Tax=Microbacterium sp. TaxID=51671 RepID=UPI003F7FFD88
MAVTPATPVAATPTETVRAAHPLTRQIPLWSLVGLIFFSVSGGAYGLEELVPAAGPGLALLLILVTPIIYGIPIAAITAELSTALPNEGGTYEWARRGLNSFWAFQAGALRWVNSWVDMALYPVMFSSYLALLLPASFADQVLFSAGPLDVTMGWLAGVVFVIIPFGIVNLFSARFVGASSAWIAVIVLIPLAVMSVVGISTLFTEGINPLVPFAPTGASAFASFGVGLSIIMWSYCGFDSVGVIAGEVKNPGRVIPKATIIAMIVIVLSYLLPTVAALATGGWEDWTTGSFGAVAAQLGGPALGIAVTVGGMIAAMGLYSSLLLSSSRVVFVLSRDRWVTGALARQTKKSGTPWVSVLVSSLLYALFSLGSFADLVVVDVFLINALLILSLAALIALRIREPQLPRPARIPGGWWGIGLVGTPMIAVILFTMITQFTDNGGFFALSLFIAIVATTVLAYFPARAYRRRHLNQEQLASSSSGQADAG